MPQADGPSPQLDSRGEVSGSSACDRQLVLLFGSLLSPRRMLALVLYCMIGAAFLFVLVYLHAFAADIDGATPSDP